MQTAVTHNNRARHISRPRPGRIPEIALTKVDKILWFVLLGLGFGGFFLGLYIAVVLYIPSREISVPYRAIMLIAACVMIGKMFLYHERFYSRWLWLPIGLFFLLYTLRIVADGYFTRQPLPDTPERMLLMTIGACLIPMVALMRNMNRPAVEIAFLGFLVFTVPFGLGTVGLYQEFFGGEGTSRMRGGQFIGDHIGVTPLGVAYMGAAMIAVGTSRLFLPRIAGTLQRRGFPILLIAAGLPPFLIGASRGAVVGLIVCAGAMTLSKLRSGQVANLLAVSVAVGIVGVGIVVAAQEVGSGVVDRFMLIGEQIQVDASGAARLYIWSTTWQGFLSSPFFGYGLVVPGVATYPHNSILEAFAGTGILGGVCFCILFSAGVLRANFLIGNHPQYSWLGALFLMYATYSLFSSSIGTLGFFWMGLGAVFGASHFLGYDNPKSGAKRKAMVGGIPVITRGRE